MFLSKYRYFFLKNPALYSSVQPARMWCSFTPRDDTVSESLCVHEATRKQHIANARSRARRGVREAQASGGVCEPAGVPKRSVKYDFLCRSQ